MLFLELGDSGLLGERFFLDLEGAWRTLSLVFRLLELAFVLTCAVSDNSRLKATGVEELMVFSSRKPMVTLLVDLDDLTTGVDKITGLMIAVDSAETLVLFSVKLESVETLVALGWDSKSPCNFSANEMDRDERRKRNNIQINDNNLVLSLKSEHGHYFCSIYHCTHLNNERF